MDIQEQSREVICQEGKVAILLNIDYVSKKIKLRPSPDIQGRKGGESFTFIQSDPEMAAQVIALMGHAVTYAKNDLAIEAAKRAYVRKVSNWRSCHKCGHIGPVSKEGRWQCCHPKYPIPQWIPMFMLNTGCADSTPKLSIPAGMGELGDPYDQ
jgi:hypothetical protein